MTTFTMLVGLSGSGKTSWAKHIVSKRSYYGLEPIAYVSSDEIREELFGDESIQENHNKVFELMNSRAKDNLKNGFDVIYDATNLSRKRRKGIISQMPKAFNGERIIFKVIYFATPYSKCLRNNSGRDRKVPEETIFKMYKRLEIPVYFEGFDRVMIKISPDPMTLKLRVEDAKFVKELIESDDIPSHDYLFLILAEHLHEEFDRITDMPQDSTYHPFSISRHTYHVYEAMRKTEYGKDFDMLMAALLHDVGKGLSKTFVNYKGDTKRYASFYDHERISSQIVYDVHQTFPYFNVDLVSQLCQFHMRLHDPNLKVGELEKLVGEDVFNRLVVLNQCDKAGK